jgi:hypothetical protein
MTFAKWMDLVDGSCESEKDMVIHVLPQDDFLTAYRRGIAPVRFSKQALVYIRGSEKGYGLGPPENPNGKANRLSI